MFVVHCKREKHDVYIGRPGPWGNPFVVGKHGARGECIELFREWAMNSDDAQARWIRDHVHELRGKVLGCWCAPMPCHGDVLSDMCNGP